MPTMPDEGFAIQRIARGTLQTFGSVYTARLIALVVRIALLQILVPEDFGAVGTAFSLLAIVVALRDFGLHYALLHSHDRVHEFAPTHFLLSISLGAFSTALALGMAVYFEQAIAYARVFEEFLGGAGTDSYPKVAMALAIFALFDFFRAGALTADVQLQRELAFGRLALAHGGGTILAVSVGLLLAYMGYGKWALILGFYPYSATYVAVYCAVVWSRFPPPLANLHHFDRQAAGNMMRYGIHFWLGGIPRLFVQHFDKLLISLFFGLSMRGLYDVAHDFAQIPTGAITLAIVRITGAVYARYQKDRAQISAAFRRALRLILRTTIPLSLILALEADRWIQVFRPEWLPAAPLLRWLIVYSLCRPVLDDVHALFYSVGSPLKIAGFASVQALVLIVLAPLLSRQMGVFGIALSMNVMALVGLVFALYLARNYVDVPVAKTFCPPLLAAGAGLALHRLAFDFLATMPILVGFVLGSSLVVFGYAAGLLLIERKTIVVEMQTVIHVLKP